MTLSRCSFEPVSSLSMGEFTGQFAEGKLHRTVLLDGECGVALEDLPFSGDACRNATFGRDTCTVRNANMAVDAHLSSNHTMRTNFRGARYSGLGGNHRMRSDSDIVCYLNEVVEFDTVPQYGRAQCGPVDGGARTDLTSFTDDDVAHLRNLLVALFGGGESESICSNDGTGLENAPHSEDALIPNGAAHAQCALWSEGYIGAHHAAR